MEKEQKRQKTPLGILLILVFTGLLILSSLVQLVNFFLGNTVPQFLIGPFLIDGVGAVLLSATVFLILVAEFYGIKKRLEWGRVLSIGYQFIAILNMLINIGYIFKTGESPIYRQLVEKNKYSLETVAALNKEMIGIMLFGLVVELIIAIYLFKKKNYFIN